MDMKEEYKVFVYGTLMRGQANHALMGSAIYEGKYKTDNRWGLINIGAFPALVPHVLAVEGEVFTVDKETLALLDRLEGVAGGMYKRRYIYVFDEDGVRDEVYAYIWGTVMASNQIRVARWSDFQ
jgi:gamma-glutamylcyclotransferase (GGCT)/AIG2-like uncharacterized protein YtfP